MCIKETCPQNLPFQPLHHHGQDQRAVKRQQSQDWRPAQGWNGLKDHQQEAWLEGDFCWCNYSKLE